MYGVSASSGGVPHEAHEGLALVLRELREESNQVPEIGGHPQWSGLWSGVFLDCGFSRRFLVNSTPRGGTETAVSFAKASDAAVSLSRCESVRLSACTDCVGFCAAVPDGVSCRVFDLCARNIPWVYPANPN